MNKPIDLLPRFDLREPAFRKYEPLIARACKESFSFDPSTMLKPMNGHSFGCRFRDAILAKTRYGYKSDSIPSNFDLTSIKVYEKPDGHVWIHSPIADFQLNAEPPACSADDPQSVITLMQRILSHEITDLPVLVPYPDVMTRDRIMAIAAAYNDNLVCKCHVSDYQGKLNFYA